MNADLLRLTSTITMGDVTTTLPDPLPVRSSIFCLMQNSTSIIIHAGTALRELRFSSHRRPEHFGRAGAKCS